MTAPVWIRTADRRPEEQDASRTGMVLAVKSSGSYVTVVRWAYCTPRAYPWWMPYPEAPEVEP